MSSKKPEEQRSGLPLAKRPPPPRDPTPQSPTRRLAGHPPEKQRLFEAIAAFRLSPQFLSRPGLSSQG